MRPPNRTYRRTGILVSIAVLALSGLASGCSGKPAYCKDADQLKTSVSNLGNVDVAKNGIGSLTTALSGVQTNADKLASDAKSAFGPQVTALESSLSSLDAAIKSAQGQPALAAASAVASSVKQVQTSASDLESAVSGKCS